MYINSFTQYEDGFEIVQNEKLRIRVISNKRLWELLECEKKDRKD